MTAATPSGDEPGRDIVRRERLLAATVPTLARWPAPSVDPTPGYSVIVPYPADLPALLLLALRALARCEGRHRLEVLAVSDPLRASTTPSAAVLGDPLGALDCPVQFLAVPEPDAALARRSGSASMFHWSQMITGIRVAVADHVLLHDVDLVINDPTFLDAHYLAARDAGAACRGVEPCWDPWFAEHGLAHVSATWELLAEVAWLRSFEPLDLRPLRRTLRGEAHDLDTLLWAQASTDPARVLRHDQGDAFHHVSFLVGTYRLFQARDIGRPFQDEHGRLLILRVLHDVLGIEAPADLPELDVLQQQLDRPDPEIVYLPDGWTHGIARSLGVLRAQADVVFTTDERRRLEPMLAPFDRAVARA